MATTYNLKLGDAAIGDLVNVVASASFTVGAEAANAITVTVQLKKYDGSNLDFAAALNWYLATNSSGLTPATSAPNGGTAAGASGKIIESVAELSGLAVSTAAGVLTFVITDSTTPTFYLVLVLPGGKLAVSGAITFA